jgi:plastocyanin
MANARTPIGMLAVAAAVGIAGCGGDESEKSAPPQASEPATTLKLTSPGGVNRYDKTRLTAPAGKVTIAFVNHAARPHNVTVIPGDKLDYKKKKVLATATVSGDFDITSAKASAPLKAGTYTYYCQVANHAALGMVGKLVIR